MGNDEDIPLYLLKRFLEMKIFHSKFSRLIVLMVLVLIQGYNVLGLYWMFHNNVFRQYITYVLLGQASIVSMLGLLTFTSGIKMPQWSHFWTKNLIGSKLRRRIHAECKVITIASACLLVANVVAHMYAVLPIYGDEGDIIHFLAVGRYYNGRLYPAFLALFYFSIALLGVCTTYSVVFVVYIITVATIQMRLLVAQLARIATEFRDVQEEEWFIRSRRYQDVIYASLTSCVKRHINLMRHGKVIRYTKDSSRQLKLPIMYLPFSTATPVAAVYFIFNEISPRSNFRMIAILIIYMFIIVGLCISGQHLEDLSHEMFLVVSQCPWMYWNRRNQRELLLLLMNCTKPLNLRSFNGIGLNFNILLTLQKWMYTLVTVLY